jgi:cellulose biosynthesis protein BcsQ
MVNRGQGYRWDAFISHNQVDKQWVRDRVSEWRTSGLQIFFDEDSILPGEDVVGALEAGLEHSRVVILVLTPAALQSQWVALETSVGLFRDPAALARRVIPVVLEPIDELQLRPVIRRLNRIDLSDQNKYRSEYRRLLDALGIGDSAPQHSHTAPHSSEAAQLPRWPFPVFSLMGTKGGTGKTTVLVATAELIASAGRNVLIVDADLESGGATRYLSSNATARPHVWTVLDAAYERQRGAAPQRPRDLGAWDVTPDYLRRNQLGYIYLIPSKHGSDTRIPWNAMADIQPAARNAAALSIIVECVERYSNLPGQIGAALIDSGAEINPLVSAGIVAADYGYIASSPHAEFASAVTDNERTHRVRYPNHHHKAMNVIVNQATEESRRGWGSYQNVYFVMEDPEFRENAAAGKVDFEGVGLNNLYLDVLKALQQTVSSAHQHLLPDPAEVWVKPYLRKLGRFPELMLHRPKYRWLESLTAAYLVLSLVVLAGSLWFLVKAVRGPYEEIFVEISPPADTSLMQLRERLERTQVPDGLREKMQIMGTSLVLKAPLSAGEKAAFLQAVNYEPLITAFNSAAKEMEEKQSLRVGVTALLIFLALGFGGFRAARFFSLRKQKRLLRLIIQLRDSGDEKTLSRWIRAILAEQSKENELRWIRDEYRVWLSRDGLRLPEQIFPAGR